MTTKQLELGAGCMWVMGQTIRGVSGPKPKAVNVFCNKLRGPDSVYCPKHALFALDEDQKPVRHALTVKARREWKAQQEAALEASPLRAENPEYHAKKKAGKAAESEETAFGGAA